MPPTTTIVTLGATNTVTLNLGTNNAAAETISVGTSAHAN
jgi:hypothetical protein